MTVIFLNLVAVKVTRYFITIQCHSIAQMINLESTLIEYIRQNWFGWRFFP